jgi:chemosensory pili system protein ChpC
MMNEHNDKVRSLWVPLRDASLLLPSVAVAEISSYRIPTPVPGMPEWCLGTIKWSGHDIPVISIEAVCGLSVQSNPVFSRLMIVNSVRQDSPVQHYAIVTSGLPGLIQFGPDTADQVASCTNEGLKCIVRVGNEEAIIPDLDYLQELLETELERAA